MDERFERVDLGGEYHHRIEVRGRNGEISVTELDTYSTGLAARMSTERARELAKAIERATGLDPAPPEPPAAVLARLDGVSLVEIATVVRDAMDQRDYELTAGRIASVIEECGYSKVVLHNGVGARFVYAPREFGAWLAEEVERMLAKEREEYDTTRSSDGDPSRVDTTGRGATD